jgi:hypothetical protein
MKKMILAVLFVSAVISVSAQEVTTYKVHNPNGTVTEVKVPPHILNAFNTTYPGVTVLMWEPVKSWWRASYPLENRVVYVFYNEQAVNYRVSLPVLQNNVPEDVVNTALKVHGPIVYGIAKMKSADNTDIYQVRLMENGSTRVVWMDGNGTAVTNMFKTADAVVTTNQL